MNIHKSAIFLIFTVLSLQSCIHTYPEDNSGDSYGIKVHAKLKLDNHWTEKLEYYPQGNETKSENHNWFETRNEETTDGDIRFALTVEIYENENEKIRLTRELDGDILTEDGIIVTLPVDFKPEKYQILLWCHSISGNDNDFNTENLHSVTTLFPHGNSGNAPDCGFCKLDLDLSGYTYTHTNDVMVDANLKIPIAKIKLVATDVGNFIHSQNNAIGKGEKYYIAVSYQTSTASTFNVADGKPTGYLNAMSFKKDMPVLFSQHVTLCSDWLLATEDESTVALTLTVFNSAQMIVSQLTNIPITIKRGCATTLRGDILTNFSQHTITIDNIWDEDIFIDL